MREEAIESPQNTMSHSDETLAAASAILRSLGRGPSPGAVQDGSSTRSGLNLSAYTLPGAPSSAKSDFEAEITALARRIQYLESRAEVVGQSLPDTPGEVYNATSPLSRPVELRTSLSGFSENGPSSHPERPSSVVSARSKRVSSLLAARDTQYGALERTVSEEDVSVLREHIERQSEEIRSQKDTIAEIGQGLRNSEEQAKQAFLRVQNEDVGVLERELRKHQQANEAFQKALREIGDIITQVANGDLSKRVQIQATEMDAEIAAFKATINTMMDQLEVFGSEVTRVAREVGTEGILGGQAQISGVHGIWKELTDNGKLGLYAILSQLTHVSQHHGCKSV